MSAKRSSVEIPSIACAARRAAALSWTTFAGRSAFVALIGVEDAQTIFAPG
jgi:hypothetical protein